MIDSIGKINQTFNIQAQSKVNIQPEQKADLSNLNNEIQTINELVENKNIKVELNEDINMIQVKELDKTGEIVLKSIPPEDFIKRVKYFKENILPTLMMDERV